MMSTGCISTQQWSIDSDEIVLISAARQGDIEAFNHLVYCYQDRIYNFAKRMLGDEEQAKDVTQDTFLKAYLNLAHFRNGSFRSWLYRIASNACCDVYRQRKRHETFSLESSDLAEERLWPIEPSSSAAILPEAEVERLELENIVQTALNQLNVSLRSVVVLVDIQGADYLEAAQILHIPIGTVKSRLARARVRLQLLLAHWQNG